MITLIRPLCRLASTLAVCATLIPAALAAEDVTVFAAASLKSALDELIKVYPGDTIHIAYGGSSSLTRQVMQGAPAQLFISANQSWMDILERDGFLIENSRIDLLGNRLALVAAPDTTVQLPPAPGFDLATAIGDGVLAMALVKAVPAGIYGKQALSALGAWDGIKGKIAQADNVRAALRLVASGEASIGVVYATDLGASSDVRLLGLFPADSHTPIHYPMALIDPTTADARAVYDFLNSATARAVFAKHGFSDPQEQP
ncbi:molybdate ABC transporter substrate-binding protein [Sedimentitalea sp. CY04]|uniref:Molybdate ABC transporter substrate-binding protein n=1 Tax=Parasedimentitalea denitrificans TaxID=2211118 RepID=A0ABX0WDI2_9RHOB|nr:molybdate ABC transporter substrate-binding protein [Sedimentitalea sp. CY04]NIZ62923.1 molybdate ABC transporter substrate-binding protein [Sedimentitalea sp. CY04]